MVCLLHWSLTNQCLPTRYTVIDVYIHIWPIQQYIYNKIILYYYSNNLLLYYINYYYIYFFIYYVFYVLVVKNIFFYNNNKINTGN